MYINYGYLNNSKIPFMDKSRPLIVGSCGTYRLSTKKKFPAWSPHGRVDYQLLYVAAGKRIFTLMVRIALSRRVIWCSITRKKNSTMNTSVQIQELYIDNNPISDLSFITSLSELRVLSLNGIPLTDYSFRKEVKKLETLYVEDCKLTKEDLQIIESWLPNCEIVKNGYSNCLPARNAGERKPSNQGRRIAGIYRKLLQCRDKASLHCFISAYTSPFCSS